MSTTASRQYNWQDDKNNGIAITASRMDAEFDNIITKLNQKVLIKATAPSSPIAGMLWLDSTNKILKEYRNSEWVTHAPVHVGTAAPTTVQEGDLWYDTTNNLLKSYNGSSWDTVTDEKVKSDSADTTAGYLDAKVDASTIEVDTTNHQLRVKDLGISEAKLAASAVSQGKLKTTTGEVSATGPSADSILTLPGGEYGFYPQLKCGTTGSVFRLAVMGHGTYDSAVVGITAAGWTAYKTQIYFRVESDTFYARQRYVTASGKDHWIFLLVVKKDYQTELPSTGEVIWHRKGQVLSSYQAPDHPSANQGGATELDIPHPFGNYDPEKHEIVLVDNDVLNEAKQRISRKRSLLTVINEDFIIDDWTRPNYEPREIIKINEFPQEPVGKVFKRMKAPQWAKIMIQADEITLEQRIVESLPANILFKKLALKK
jgi:hypothetical protein